jgi:hypothetical protein
MVVLQALTLMAALGAWPTAATVEATQNRRADDQEQDVLPNAAGQRQEQIRLLKEIAGELSEMNGKLDKIHERMANQAEAN